MRNIITSDLTNLAFGIFVENSNLTVNIMPLFLRVLHRTMAVYALLRHAVILLLHFHQ